MKKVVALFFSLLFVLSGCSTMGTPSYSQNGRISSIRIFEVEEKVPSLGGAALGGTAGGIVGHQFGKGNGKTAMTVLGVLVGAGVGANAGSSIQLVQKADVIVHLDDGNVERLVVEPRGLFVGKRVNISKYGDTVKLNSAQ